jgi:hypothetical protein
MKKDLFSDKFAKLVYAFSNEVEAKYHILWRDPNHQSVSHSINGRLYVFGAGNGLIFRRPGVPLRQIDFLPFLRRSSFPQRALMAELQKAASALIEEAGKTIWTSARLPMRLRQMIHETRVER